MQCVIGFALGANGWLRVSAEVADQEPTKRAGLDNRPGFTELGKKYQVGIPNSHSYNTFFNWGYDFTPNVSLYGSAHYGMLMAEPMAFYRYGTHSPVPKNDLMHYIFPYGDGFHPFYHCVSLFYIFFFVFLFVIAPFLTPFSFSLLFFLLFLS